MKVLKLLTNNPQINLSSEYYYLVDDEFKNDDIFIFWKNKNTVVIGKNQGLAAEVNQIYAKDHDMKIVRRFSGGGAVYHDDGNICFTFIKRNQKNNFDFKKSLTDIIDFFNSVGVNAYFSGRNDILVNERKVSGNAVYFWKNDYMIHGTLLFDVDIEKLVTVLTVDQSKLSSKGIESVRSRVLNICDVYSKGMKEFENDFIKFFETKYNTQCIELDNTNNPKVLDINNNIFGNKNWIYERDFDFNFTNSIKTDKGLVTLKLCTSKNIITDIDMFSDSLLALDLKEVAKQFINQKYEIENIKEIASKINLNEILENLNIDQFISLFFKI